MRMVPAVLRGHLIVILLKEMGTTPVIAALIMHAEVERVYKCERLLEPFDCA
jgi:hypothetical protein